MSNKNLKDGMLFTVEKSESGRVYTAKSTSGSLTIDDEISYALREEAHSTNQRLLYKNGEFEIVDNSYVPTVNRATPVLNLIASAYDYKPLNVVMKKNSWKLLFRNGLKGKNTLMTGNAGSGKSTTVAKLAKVLGCNYHYFNLGATQDPRSSLIGNTLFSQEKGTYHSESEFIRAIQTKNTIILLDEISRAHPDAWNILMTVLDPAQRYLRIDEAEGQEVIHVAEGVCFIATANIGTQYTSTRSLDRALFDRFSIVEMEQLTSDQEKELLKLLVPEINTEFLIEKVDILGSITEEVRNLHLSGEVSSHFSTRMVVNIAELLVDGFSLFDALEVTLLPLYDSDGGADSERAKILKAMKKHLPEDEQDSPLFDKEEEADDDDDNPFMPKN